MTPAEISAIIQREIDAAPRLAHSHGVDLGRCLVTPRKLQFKNSFPNYKRGEPLDLWIVLEETPGTRGGYLIVYNEEEREFGLAVWGDDLPIFIGCYGTFISTLVGM